VPEALGAGATPGRRLIRGGAARVAAYGAGNLLTAAAAVLLLRHLGVADFGRYGTVIALLTIVQGHQRGRARRHRAARARAARRPAQRALLAHVVGARIALTTAGVAVAVGLSALFGYGPTLVSGAAVAGAGILLASVQAALLLPLGVEARQGRLAVNETVRQGVVAAAIAGLVVADAPLGAFFFAHLAAGVVLMAVAPLVAGGRALVAPRFGRAELGRLARVALPVAVASVVAVVYYRALVVVVSLLEDERQTGLYVTAARILELAGGLPMLLSVVAVPLLTVAARDDPARLQRVLQRTTEVMAVAGVAVALGIGVGGAPARRAARRGGVRGGRGALRLQCVALATLFVGAAWTPVLVGRGPPAGGRDRQRGGARDAARPRGRAHRGARESRAPRSRSSSPTSCSSPGPGSRCGATTTSTCGSPAGSRRPRSRRSGSRWSRGCPTRWRAAGAVAAFLGLALALGLVPRDLLAAARR
jgi:O-antigen/teichoic acid export membrane protein